MFFELGYRVHPSVGGPAALAGLAPLAGTYKLGGFYDSGQFEDNGGRGLHRGNHGCYFVAEQEIWHPEGKATRALAFFGRVGVAPDDRNTVPLYFDTGFDFRGILPSHVDDTLGLGFSYTQVSDGLADKGGIEIGGGYEGVAELTYRMSLGEHVFLQPDLQFIIHPGAVESAATAVVAGLRLNIHY